MSSYLPEFCKRCISPPTSGEGSQTKFKPCRTCAIPITQPKIDSGYTFHQIINKPVSITCLPFRYADREVRKAMGRRI